MISGSFHKENAWVQFKICYSENKRTHLWIFEIFNK